MKNFVAPAAIALMLGAVPTLAPAQGTLAFTATDSQLFAGPSGDYPVVAVLGGGVQVAVQGCLPDYTWCDVTAGANRGWLYSGDINYPYQGAALPLLTYGGAIGIGVLGFTLNDYWGSYYRARPWYRERSQWFNRPYVRSGPPLRGAGDRQHPRMHQEAAPQWQGRESWREGRPGGERGERGERGQERERGEHEGRSRR